MDRPVPKLSKAPLKLKIKGGTVAPGKYQKGTAEFRYWTAAEALRRGADYWNGRGISAWQVGIGTTLPVALDEGVDLNAFYDRTELAFFHEDVGGETIYSGESPDVVCHELGHACLDAHRPQLWDAPFIEVGSFHESFGDMSAILAQLQLKSVRTAALSGIKLNKASKLSRLAEQLGWAIRQVDPADVDPDCLRNAYNSFKYADPQTLPDSAPATQLCAEVHSFSRVFTGAFYEILSGMLKIRAGSSPTEADLQAVAADIGQLLMDATTAAPVQPDYYAQVASHVIDADTARFSGKYRSALVSTFVGRKIVPQSAVTALTMFKGKAPAKNVFGMAVSTDQPSKPQVHRVQLSSRDVGLNDERPIIVQAPIERKPFLMVAAALLHKETEPASVEQAARRFVRMLAAHRRIDTGSRKRKLAAGQPRDREHLRHTHVLIESAEGLRLQRRLFHCGCRCGGRS